MALCATDEEEEVSSLHDTHVAVRQGTERCSPP
jgi:hypothetical protein